MSFWHGPIVDLLILLVILAAFAGIRRSVPALAALGVPTSMAAGIAALILGPSVLGLAPFEPATFESVVYHGLGLVFTGVALTPTDCDVERPGVKSVAFAVPIITLVQALIGLLLVAIASLSEPIHPGYGLELALGFSQGPGQALSLGRAWEAGGMVDGGQIGLAVAAIGFIGSCIVGVPLVHVARRMGWAGDLDGALGAKISEAPPPAKAGELDVFTRQLAVVGAVYLATYLLLSIITAQMEGTPDLAAMVWGFHYMVAFLIALATRWVLTTWVDGFLNAPTMRRFSGATVDIVTASAFAAVQLAVLMQYLVPLLLLTGAGMVVTLFICVWIGRRAFPLDPFGYTLALFGVCTGTLPTGLALLRVYDPEMRGPATEGLLRGVAGALIPAAPLLLVFLPMAANDWRNRYPGGLYSTMGLMAAYLVFLCVAWWWSGALRMTRPLGSMWPSQPATDA